MGDERPEAEERERPPPKVVDKRISARSQESRQAEPTPSAESAPKPPTASARAEPSPGAVDAGAEAEVRRMADEIRRAPSRDWVVNVALTLVNVASVKLSSGDTAEAGLAIDALAALVKSVGDRLGDAEAPLRQTLAELQLAFARAGQ